MTPPPEAAHPQDHRRQPEEVCLVGMGWFPDQPGGLNRYVREVYRALEAGGHAVRLVVAGPAPSAPASVVVAGDARQPLPRRLLDLRRAAGPVLRRSDVVDTHFALYAVPVLAGRGRGRSLVVHFHGPWAQESRSAGQGGLNVTAKRAVERWVYRRADRCVVLSETFRDVLVRDYGVPEHKVTLVRPGVDLDRFAPSGDVAALKQGMGLPPAPVVLAVRRLVPRMGLDVLLDAWAQADVGDARLVVVGDGPSRAELEDQVARSGLSSSVHLAGRVSDEDLPRWFALADLSVVPSLSLEGFGLTVLESLATGTPVVVSDLGGMGEVLPELSPSLVVPPGDVGALAERLGSAVRDPGSLPSAAQCRAFAEAHGWDRTAEQVAAVYGDVRGLARRRGRAATGERPRVVYVGHSAALSGGELALLTQLPALRTVDVHVVLAEDGPLVGRLQAAGISVEVLEMPTRTAQLRKGSVRPTDLPLAAVVDTAAYVRRLADRLRELGADVVHTNSLKANLYGGVAARLAGVPQVWHARDRIATDYLPGPAVLGVRAAARLLPAAVVANSEATLATLPGRRRPGRTVVLPSPVPAISVPVVQRAADRPLVVGCIGRLSPWKGQDVLLRAVAQAFPAEDVQVRVVGAALFGEHEYETSLRQLVTDLGLDERVVLTGFVDDVPAELARMDVLVHCSTVPEPFGQVVVQGMAAGLPVVAADAGGPAEIIEDGRTGLLTPPGDVAALAAALRRLAADADLCRRLGEGGRAVAASYEPERLAPRLEHLYDDLVHGS